MSDIMVKKEKILSKHESDSRVQHKKKLSEHELLVKLAEMHGFELR